MREVNSMTVFFSRPRAPRKIQMISLKVFLKIPPYHVGPGFPFEDPSKLSLKKPMGGRIHLSRLFGGLCFGENCIFALDILCSSFAG